MTCSAGWKTSDFVVTLNKETNNKTQSTSQRRDNRHIGPLQAAVWERCIDGIMEILCLEYGVWFKMCFSKTVIIARVKTFTTKEKKKLKADQYKGYNDM